VGVVSIAEIWRGSAKWKKKKKKKKKWDHERQRRRRPVSGPEMTGAASYVVNGGMFGGERRNGIVRRGVVWGEDGGIVA